MPLAIEPLHPMTAADRCVVNTLGQALDLCDALGEGVGVTIDTYHVWWDPDLARQIARAGAGGRILAHHICDWLVPTRDLLNDRGMMGDGIIDFRGFRRMIEAAGFHGPQEVEIFSAENWWKRPGDEVLRTCIDRYRACCALPSALCPVVHPAGRPWQRVRLLAAPDAPLLPIDLRPHQPHRPAAPDRRPSSAGPLRREPVHPIND
jgi:hypothetical protein